MPFEPDDRDIILPFNAPSGKVPFRRGYILLGVLFCVFLALHNAVPLYTDWLWFGEVGHRVVFTTTLIAKTVMFCAAALVFFVIFFGNISYSRRLASSTPSRALLDQFGPVIGTLVTRGIGWLLLGVAVFFALWAGRLATDYWASYMEFLHWTPFGVRDPVFGNDIGFYVFRVPLYRFVCSFILTTLFFTAVAVAGIFVVTRTVESWSRMPSAQSGVRGQILLLGAALAFVQACATRLDGYDLLFSNNDVFWGPGYTDLHFRLLALNVQTAILVLTGLAALGALMRGRDLRWPLYGLGAWFAASVLLGVVVPTVAQKLSVDPNQFSMEKPYLARNIQFTRQGFGLDHVRVVDSLPADESLTSQQLRNNQDTLSNVRLWDYSFLGRVYDQTQTEKRYFAFRKLMPDGTKGVNVDVDRYSIGGHLRQVMLAAREFDADGLPAETRTWQNERLGYTHGYGLVMSPVNTAIGGAPEYFIQGFPPVASASAANLRVQRPEIYYGELNDDYVFVDTDQQEFDPAAEVSGAAPRPAGGASYRGTGGIRIGDSALARMAFALRFADQNILLAKNFRAGTRVLFRRDIRERLQLVAPFVQLDGDPYLVVGDDGRLVWIVDCYTYTDRYPYSTPETMAVAPDTSIAPNYMRNSVKATVDAYDGTVKLYVADKADPIVRTYDRIFPGLLEPLDRMPASLRAHLRYPEDLFRVQRSVYATYHVSDPRVFYRKDDAWAVPAEPSTDQAAQEPAKMEPYYVIMRLPSSPDEPETRKHAEEFLLMSPLAPLNQESRNILGWMCARCDGAHYGELVLYRFPQQRSVVGPSQVVALINSDAGISAELSLLRSRGGGSSADLGNLLVIPVEKSLLYIAPLYVEATGNAQLPQLQRVVVVFGGRAAMDSTLDGALAKLFVGYSGPAHGASGVGSEPSAPAASGPAAASAVLSTVAPQVRTLIETAVSQYGAAQQHLKSGDFAGYGAATQELSKTLERLRAMTTATANAPARK